MWWPGCWMDLPTFCTIPLQARDGTLIPVETKVTRGTWNHRPALFGVSRDVTERQHAQEVLRASEESYRSQFTKNSVAMLLIDPADGAIIDANAAAVSFYGYPRERMLAMHIADINVLPVSEVTASMATVTQQRGSLFVFQHRLCDGSVRDVEVSSSAIQLGERMILHSIVHDITERIRAEKENQAPDRPHQLPPRLHS